MPKTNVLTIKQNHYMGVASLAANMEEPLRAARNFANAIAIMSEALDDGPGCAIQEIAFALLDKIGRAEEQRGFIIKLAHR